MEIVIHGRHLHQVLDQDCLLEWLELYLKRYLIGFVLAEQHPAGFALVGDLLHCTQAPLLRFHFQNKGSVDHDLLVGLLGLIAGLVEFDWWIQFFSFKSKFKLGQSFNFRPSI